MLILNVIIVCYGNECNCSSGYKARMEDDKLHCVNYNNGKIIPCIPAPHCKCFNGAIKVNWGKNGEFCAVSYNYRMRIWPCENKEDWKNFRNKLKEKV